MEELKATHVIEHASEKPLLAHNNHDSQITQSETAPHDNLKNNGAAEETTELLKSSRDSVTSMNLHNGFHKSSKEDGHHATGDDDNQKTTDVADCSVAPCTVDAHLSSSHDDLFQTKSEWKTNGELEQQATMCYNAVSSTNKISGGGVVSIAECRDDMITASSCKESDVTESSKQLLELMQFLQAPTNSIKTTSTNSIKTTSQQEITNLKSHECAANKESSVVFNNNKSNPMIDSTTNVLDQQISLNYSSQSVACRDEHLSNVDDDNAEVEITAVVQDFTGEKSADISPEKTMLTMNISLKTNATSESHVKEISMNPDLNPCSEYCPEPVTKNDPLHFSKEIPNDCKTSQPSVSQTILPSINEEVKLYNDDDNQTDAISSSQLSLSSSSFQTSSISMPPSHRPMKKRIGLENILLRRLLQAAKPVNHHSTAAAGNDLKLDPKPSLEPTENVSLHLNKSVHILTDHPESITVLENESSSSRVIKDILEQNSKSLTEEEQIPYDDSENNSKRTHKRKCSSPHRIVKKMMTQADTSTKIKADLDVIASPKTFPISQISKPVQSSINMKSNAHTVHSEIMPLPTSVPFLSGLSMNVITIAPDESYIEPSLLLKPKPSMVKPLRQLAPKIQNSPVNFQTSVGNNVLASKHITTSTNVIPISLVQSTTTPSLVILVNKTDPKNARLISAQPFQLQPQLPQHKNIQQIAAVQQITSTTISLPISNIIQTAIPLRSTPQQQQQQQLFKTLPQPISITSEQLQSSSSAVINCSRSKSMPKLRPIANIEEHVATKPVIPSSCPGSLDHSFDGNSEKFFEPFRNNCILGKYVAPQLEPLKLKLEECNAANSRHVCGSCGCTFASESALKEHCERKSFLVTFECSCQLAGESCTFYNLCSFSIYYRNHVLQNPYVPHSPATNYKISVLPDDQLPEECMKLLKEKEKSFVPPIEHLKPEVPVETSPSFLGVSVVTNKSKETLQCKECNKEFRLPLRIKHHFQNWNKTVAKSTNSERNTGDVSIITPPRFFYKCLECMIILPNPCSFKAHSRLHDSTEPYVCPECGLTFSTFEVMKEHAYTICYHGCRRANIKGCRFCNYIPHSSTSLSECLDAHILKAHTPTSYKCPHCPEIFKDGVSLESHSQLTHGVVLLNGDIQMVSKCSVCEEFVKSSTFEVHLSGHDDEFKSKMYLFSCTECDKNFVYRAELEKHLRISGHLGMKANGFVCKLCALTYSSQEERCKHIIAEHNNVRGMFLNELNKSILPALPLIGPREVVSSSRLYTSKHKLMPPLRFIDYAVASSKSMNDLSAQEPSKDSLHTAALEHQLSSTCGIRSSEEHTHLSTDITTLKETPERWECSKCNEIFLNKAAFHRHQQKHRFLEQSKSKKRKMIDDAESALAKTTCVTDHVITSTSCNTIIVSNDGNTTKTVATSSDCNMVSPTLTADASLASAITLDTSADSPDMSGNIIKEEEIDNMSDNDGSSNNLIEPNPPLSHDDAKTIYKESTEDHSTVNDKWHSCQLCCLSFRSSEKLQYHIVTHHVGLHPVKPETFTCSYCSETSKRIFISIRHLHKHLRVKHKIIRNKAGQYISLDSSLKLDLTQNQGFADPEIKEGESSSDGKFALELFPTSPISEEHGNVYHDDTCASMEIDDETIKDHVNVRSRKMIGSLNGVYVCSYCECSDPNRSTFWEHIISHEEEFFQRKIMTNHKTFQCPECGSMFVVRVALFRHLKLVHKMLDEQEYETELDEFESFRAHHKSLTNSLQSQDLQPHKVFQHDLPADKLAKLAALRPEDIHSSLIVTPKTPFFPVETLNEHSLQKRQGLRSQIKSSSTEGISSSECQDSSSQNECQVCYKTFDNQVELKVHMRVHGMAFIQGTRRSLPVAGAMNPGSAPTNQKAVIV